MAHPGGRPLKFKSAKEIETIANKYFQKCEAEDKPFLITGLALALDTDRITLIRYAEGTYDEKDAEFSNAIKRAKLRVENYAESRIYAEKQNPAGAIFALKNYGWTDKIQNENSGAVELVIKHIGSDGE